MDALPVTSRRERVTTPFVTVLAVGALYAVGAQLSWTVVGAGSTPLLGDKLIPAGALHPDSDGRTLTPTIFGG